MISGTLSGASQAHLSDMRGEFGQRAQNFKALGDALQSGDLAGAQKAYDSLKANAPKDKDGDSDKNPLSQDFDALGQALQSGDLASAQKAFGTLQQDGQALHKAHHHHRNAQAAQASQGVELSQETDTTTPAGLSGATLDVSV